MGEEGALSTRLTRLDFEVLLSLASPIVYPYRHPTTIASSNGTHTSATP
jgi:hypothetical protein